MNESALIVFGIAVFFLMAIITFVVLSRINGRIEEVDHVEPLGDMVDIKNVINHYGE